MPKYFTITILILSTFLLNGCLTSGADIQASLPGAEGDLTISGQIQTGGSNASLSPRFLTAETDDESSEDSEDSETTDYRVRIFTIEGERLGTGYLDADGNFSLPVDLDVLRGGEDTDTEFSEGIIITSPELGIENFMEFSYADGMTDFDTGTSDTDTTLAAQMMAGELNNFSTWGIAYDSYLNSTNLNCSDVLFETFWENLENVESDTVGALAAQLRAVLTGLNAAGADLEAWGYTTYAELLQDLISGRVNLVDGLWEQIVEQAALGNPDLDTAAALAAYDDGANTYLDQVGDIFFDASLASDSSALLTRYLSSDVSGLCGLFENEFDAADDSESEIARNVFTGMLTQADSVDTGSTIFANSDSLLLYGHILEECSESDTCETFGENIPVMYGLFRRFSNDLDSLLDDNGDFDDKITDLFLSITENCDNDSTLAESRCGMSMAGIVDVAGVDEFLDNDSESIDSAEIDRWTNYFTSDSEFDPEVTSTDYYTEVFQSTDSFIESDSSTPFFDCLDQATTIAERETCYDTYSVSTPSTASDTYGTASTTDTSTGTSSGSGTAATASTTHPVTQSDWTQVVSDGLYSVSGNSLRSEAFPTLHSFNSKLFVGSVYTASAAKLWKMDSSGWSSLATATSSLETRIPAITSTTGEMFFGTQTAASTGNVYHSALGSAFASITTVGRGYVASTNTGFKALHVFTNSSGYKHLYAGTQNSTNGAEIWRIRSPIPAGASPSDWQKVLDLGSSDYEIVKLLSTNRGIYAATYNTATGSRLFYSTTGNVSTWSEISSPGLGSTFNTMISAMVEFNGKLYLGTYNPTFGPELWKYDEVNSTMTEVDLSDMNPLTALDGINDLTVGPDGALWVSAGADPGTPGYKIYASYDGENFTQVNSAGFALPSNTGPISSMVNFGGYLWWGGANTNGAVGAQIWRVAPPSP